MGAADAILGIAAAYRACTDPNKVNVCVGAYRDEHGQPWVLPSVRAAERILLECNENKEYLPIAGDPDFIKAAVQFSYGPDMDLDHIAAVQTLSGTGACRVGGLFLAQFWPKHPIYVPDPTWGNHIAIFKQAGLVVKKYRYYDRRQNAVDLRGMLRDLTKAPDGSIILLHACGMCVCCLFESTCVLLLAAMFLYCRIKCAFFFQIIFIPTQRTIRRDVI